MKERREMRRGAGSGRAVGGLNSSQSGINNKIRQCANILLKTPPCHCCLSGFSLPTTYVTNIVQGLYLPTLKVPGFFITSKCKQAFPSHISSCI